MVDIVNNVYLFFFIFSILIVTRNIFFLLRSIKLEEKFIIDRTSLIVLGVAISYFITSVITFLT